MVAFSFFFDGIPDEQASFAQSPHMDHTIYHIILLSSITYCVSSWTILEKHTNKFTVLYPLLDYVYWRPSYRLHLFLKQFDHVAQVVARGYLATLKYV